MKPYRIGIVGSGNLAYHLCNSLLENGHHISWIYSRTKKHAAHLANKYNLSFSNTLEDLDASVDFILVAIKDDAIENMMKNISEMLHFKSIILHTSGTVHSKIAKGYIKNYGVFYPLQTFSKKMKLSFNDIPICITGNSKRTVARIKHLANSLSKSVFEIDDQQRFVLHVSAVFACNFTNHMYTIAEKILADHKLNFNMLRPLISETSKKITIQSPQKSQTGPAIRKDTETIKKHLEFLEKYPDWQILYKRITKDIM